MSSSARAAGGTGTHQLAKLEGFGPSRFDSCAGRTGPWCNGSTQTLQVCDRGSNPRGSTLAASFFGLVSFGGVAEGWGALSGRASGVSRACLFWDRGLGTGRSPYKAEIPVQLGAVPLAAMV